MDLWKNTVIPLNYLGIPLLVLSLVVNAFALFIIYKIVKRQIPLKRNVKNLMIVCNFGGILWSFISMIRYYYYTFAYTELLHFGVGMVVIIGDLMGQFEILKLFRAVTGLHRNFIFIGQCSAFIFCTFCCMGTFVQAAFPEPVWIQLWGFYGAFVAVLFIVLFYIWYQIFLTTKLYQSMNLSLHEDTSISNDQKKKYFTLIAEYTLLGLYQLVGLALWGWGMTGGMGSMDLVWALVFIRTGECVAQSHVAFSSIFVKHIKEFKFPRKKKEPVNQIVRLNELFSNQDRGDNSTPTMVTPRATVTTLHKGSNRPSLAL